METKEVVILSSIALLATAFAVAVTDQVMRIIEGAEDV